MTILAKVCFDTIDHLIDDLWGCSSANQISGFVIDLQWVSYEPIHLVHLLNCASLSNARLQLDQKLIWSFNGWISHDQGKTFMKILTNMKIVSWGLQRGTLV